MTILREASSAWESTMGKRLCLLLCLKVTMSRETRHDLTWPKPPWSPHSAKKKKKLKVFKKFLYNRKYLKFKLQVFIAVLSVNAIVQRDYPVTRFIVAQDNRIGSHRQPSWRPQDKYNLCVEYNGVVSTGGEGKELLKGWKSCLGQGKRWWAAGKQNLKQVAIQRNDQEQAEEPTRCICVFTVRKCKWKQIRGFSSKTLCTYVLNVWTVRII